MSLEHVWTGIVVISMVSNLCTGFCAYVVIREIQLQGKHHNCAKITEQCECGRCDLEPERGQ